MLQKLRMRQIQVIKGEVVRPAGPYALGGADPKIAHQRGDAAAAALPEGEQCGFPWAGRESHFR